MGEEGNGKIFWEMVNSFRGGEEVMGRSENAVGGIMFGLKSSIGGGDSGVSYL